MRVFRMTYHVGASPSKQTILLGNFSYTALEKDLEFFLSKKDPEFNPSYSFCKIVGKEELSLDQVKITDLSVREMLILFG